MSYRWGIENKTRYIEDYLELYVKTIKPEFERLTHGRGIYVTSSPSNGKQTEGEGFLAKQPGSSYYGDGKYIFLIIISVKTVS